jgi:hypothetical protein
MSAKGQACALRDFFRASGALQSSRWRPTRQFGARSPRADKTHWSRYTGIMNTSYPHGSDYEWFATDAKGRIARFTTGGLGPIPSVVMSNEGARDAARDELTKVPRRGDGRTFVSYPKLDDFIRCAEAGIYTYDCNDLCSGSDLRRYQLVSEPLSPLSLDDVSTLVREAVLLVALDDIEFGKTVEIAPNQLGSTVTAG